jgi:hypothetical protein
MGITTGNGAATRRVLKGRLNLRHLDKRQRAVLAADLVDGRLMLQPSIQQAAALLEVNSTYVGLALRLSDGIRAAILSGDPIAFTALLDLPAKQLVRSKPVNGNGSGMSDARLVAIAKTVGVNRMLTAAAAAEAASR